MLNYLSTILECVAVMLVCKCYLHSKKRILLSEAAVLILDVLVVNLFLLDNTLILFFAGQIMVFLICLANIRSIKNALYLSMLCFITLFISQIAASISVALFYNIINNEQTIGLLGNLFTIVVILLIMLTPIKRLYSIIVSTSFTYKVSLISSYAYLITLLIICQYNMKYLYANSVLFVIVIVILIISNAILLYYEKVLSLKNQDLETYKKYLPIYENLINDIRASQHEFTNRIQALQILCDSPTINEDLINKLREYTSAYSKPLHAYPLLTVDKPLFAASLYSLYLKAQTNNITVAFDVSSTHLNSTISEVMLSDFSCILLQNAIEASKPYDNIYINISSNDGKTTFEIRNQVDRLISDSEISSFFKCKNTSKNNDYDYSHGYGLYYLSKEMNKNNGEVLATCISFNDKYWIIFRITV